MATINNCRDIFQAQKGKLLKYFYKFQYKENRYKSV